MKTLNIIISCSILFVTACTPMGLQERDEVEILPSPLPTHYDSLKLLKIVEVEGLSLEKGKAWWESFNSSDLNMLEQMALDSNFDVLSALARLEQSAATYRKSLGASYPSLDLNASAGRQRRRSQTTTDADNTVSYDTNLDLSFMASYQIDLWGKVAAQKLASDANFKASEQDYKAAGMSVAAAVANNWIDLLSNNAEKEVLEKQIKINRNLVEMQDIRFKNALAGSTDVLQQQETLAASLAERPLLKQNNIALRNSLAILLGKLPGDLPEFDQSADLPMIGPVPDVGLPAEILSLRPDIQSAFLKLEAADLNVSIARANRFPSINLSISQAFSAPDTSLIFLNWVTNFVSSLTAPLFDGGQLKAEEERTRAVAKELVQNYSKTVASAIEEVNNALVADVAQQNRLALQMEQYELSQKATEATLKAYLEGSDTFLRFITQLTASQNLERSLVTQKANVLKARINLCQALGGLYFPNNQL